MKALPFFLLMFSFFNLTYIFHAWSKFFNEKNAWKLNIKHKQEKVVKLKISSIKKIVTNLDL